MPVVMLDYEIVDPSEGKIAINRDELDKLQPGDTAAIATEAGAVVLFTVPNPPETVKAD